MQAVLYELSLLPEDVEDENDDDEEEEEEDNEDDEDRNVQDVVNTLNLDDHQAELLMEMFRRFASNGELNRRTFEAVFESVLGSEDEM